jgi:O-antigen/teichoic acid export membrane protein
VLRRLLQNTGSNLALHFVKIAITFVMTPVIVRALGNYDYGIWEMVIAVVGYMGLLDLGFRPTISRYAAKFNAERDPQGLQVLFSTSVTFLGGVGAVLMTILVGVALLFPQWLAAPGGDATRYSIFLAIIGLQLFAAFVGNVAESMLEGLQLYYVKNSVTIFNSVVGAICTFLFIRKFDPLLVLALLNGIGTTTKFATFFVLLKRARGGSLQLTTRYRSLKFLKESFAFSIKSFIQGLATSLESSAPPVIIGAILGPAVVVFYSLPAALAKQVRSLVWTLTHAFMPLFSDLHARGQGERVAQVYMTGSRILLAVIAPTIVLIVMLGPQFIGRWIGPEYGERAAGILPFLVCAFLAPSLNPFVGRYLTALGQHGFLAKAGPVSALSGIALSLILIHRHGVEGVAVALMVPAVLLTMAVTVYACRHIGVSVSQYFRKTLLPLIVPLALMTLVAWELEKVLRGETYFEMGVIAGASALVYLAVMPWFVTNRDERAMASAWLGALLARLRRRTA